MKGANWNSSGLYLELRQHSLHALFLEEGLEISIERQENGRLTGQSAERLMVHLRDFLKKHSCPARLRAFCAIEARGVSLRRLTLPSSAREELERLLPLQIESEFPLPPD